MAVTASWDVALRHMRSIEPRVVTTNWPRYQRHGPVSLLPSGM